MDEPVMETPGGDVDGTEHFKPTGTLFVLAIFVATIILLWGSVYVILGSPALGSGGDSARITFRGETALVTLDVPGVYAVTLTVADAAGNTGTLTRTVIVEPAGSNFR
mgnify:CR=1 FL=1